MKKPAPCHPEREHHARGLCKPCYTRINERERYARAPEKKRAAVRTWGRANLEKKVDYNARWRAANPDKKRLQHFKERYGLTPGQLRAMHEEQGGCCAICLQVRKRLVVDHCHATGVVRFLLCQHCNSYLGKVEADPTLLGRLSDYAAMAKAVREGQR